MRLPLLGQGPDTHRPYKTTKPLGNHFIVRPILQALGCQRTDSKSIAPLTLWGVRTLENLDGSINYC